MSHLEAIHVPTVEKKVLFLTLIRYFCAGLLLPLSFAPFHIPGAALMALAFLYTLLNKKYSPILGGFFFGLGFYGLGISWVFVSIHQYGHLNYFFSLTCTLLFIAYLSLFPLLLGVIFYKLRSSAFSIRTNFLFSALWTLLEYCRATFFTGFPWLLVGQGQIDAPFKTLFPLIGTYGVGFLTCFAAGHLAKCMQLKSLRQSRALLFFVLLILSPLVLYQKQFTHLEKNPLSVSVIQSNVSMRDKWDQSLFFNILERYKQYIDGVWGQQLIVLPESAIPLPEAYVDDYLFTLNEKAKEKGSAIILGMPEANIKNDFYYNALISLGQANGHYFKQHLVPFGEYIPQAMDIINKWIHLPEMNLIAGEKNQKLVQIQGQPIASLICYELAYSSLLRQQLPKAKWIISLSDAGWFGHSLAMYQQLQMAQIRSAETGRYQILANNDGLSSIINAKGELIDSLPAFSSGVLMGTIYPSYGKTPWVYFGDLPVIFICALIVIYSVFLLRFRS